MSNNKTHEKQDILAQKEIVSRQSNTTKNSEEYAKYAKQLDQELYGDES